MKVNAGSWGIVFNANKTKVMFVYALKHVRSYQLRKASSASVNVRSETGEVYSDVISYQSRCSLGHIAMTTNTSQSGSSGFSCFGKQSACCCGDSFNQHQWWKERKRARESAWVSWAVLPPVPTALILAEKGRTKCRPFYVTLYAVLTLLKPEHGDGVQTHSI